MAGDKGSDGSITTSDGTVMTKGDVEFLMVCIQHTTGGQLVIDQAGVAAALGMKNVRSVGNKVGAMKKKYNLPLGTSTKGSAAESPSIPKTTKGDKVNKTPTKKKAATSKAHLLAKKEEPENEDEVEQEDEEEDAASGAEEEDLEEA